MEHTNDALRDGVIYGKVAKFGKNVKASNVYAQMENVKIPKNQVWYILVEKQDNELHMLKYNRVDGVNLVQFVSELKRYYMNLYQHEPRLVEMLSTMSVVGEDKFSVVTNIPNVTVNGKKLVAKMAEDLINLLAI